MAFGSEIIFEKIWAKKTREIQKEELIAKNSVKLIHFLFHEFF